MPTGCSMNIMMEEMPHRVFDVGIAESHAVTFSAGMAVGGMIPFCNIYSSFMQRSYDQVIHDVALQNLPVILCLDRAGLVGEDGPTHHGIFDIAAYRNVPNLILASPMNEIELRNLLFTAQKNPQPFMIRYPRGYGKNVDWKKPFSEVTIGKGLMIRDGNDLAILSYGPIGNNALVAAIKLEAEDISCAVYNMRFVKPLDTELLNQVLKKHKIIITIEDGVVSGGFGSAVLEFMAENGYKSKLVRLGIPDYFIEHGKVEELYKICGIDTNSIITKVKEIMGSKRTSKSEISVNENAEASSEIKPELKPKKKKPDDTNSPTLF
jgi:1-deoxy-D-xylulose-5-phosphate synthase